MKTKYTPGPWVIDRDISSDQPLSIFPDDGGSRIAVVEHYLNPKTKKMLSGCEANARLIASAPEMYQALKRINDSGIWADPSLIGIHNAIKAAIAKAEGK